MPKIFSAIDIEDILIPTGLACLGYGLYLYLPWLSFTVVGSLILLLGIAMARNGKANGGK